MRIAVAVCLSLVAASPAAAYSISAQSIGAGGSQDASCDTLSCDGSTPSEVEIGNVLTDVSNNSVDGHALTNGATGSLGGHMKVHILDYYGAQVNNQGSYLLEKKWVSEISETIESFQLDPGATELVVRVHVSGEDTSDLVPAPLVTFDNGFARSHAYARLLFYNANSHTANLGQITATGRADRNLPGDWEQVFGGDSDPPGYGSASGGAGSAIAELHIPASEVDSDDTLLVAGRLNGEVQGGHWNGAFAASEMHGGMSFEILGASGAPQNPIFLSAPEPEGALLGGAAIAAIGTMLRRRRR